MVSICASLKYLLKMNPCFVNRKGTDVDFFCPYNSTLFSYYSVCLL